MACQWSLTSHVTLDNPDLRTQKPKGLGHDLPRTSIILGKNSLIRKKAGMYTCSTTFLLESLTGPFCNPCGDAFGKKSLSVDLSLVCRLLGVLPPRLNLPWC